MCSVQLAASIPHNQDQWSFGMSAYQWLCGQIVALAIDQAWVVVPQREEGVLQVGVLGGLPQVWQGCLGVAPRAGPLEEA